MKRFRQLVLAFLLAQGVLFAQQNAEQEIRFRQLGKAEGLTELGFSGLQTLAFSADGTLWCGTQKGLFRFDGRQFWPFRRVNGAYHPLSSLPITALHVATDGALWAGSSNADFIASALQMRSIILPIREKLMVWRMTASCSSTLMEMMFGLECTNMAFSASIPTHKRSKPSFRSLNLCLPKTFVISAIAFSSC